MVEIYIEDTNSDEIISIYLAFWGKLREVNFFLTQTCPNSTGYSQSHPELARDGSDCNQHEFGLVCVRKKLTSLNFPQNAKKIYIIQIFV